MTRRRTVRAVQNPRNAKQVGTGAWIPAKAVRFNANGSVSVAKTSAAKNRGRRRRNVAAGFYEEETGIFHPIRASYDYSRSAAGEKPLKKRGRKRAKAKKSTAKRRRR